MAGLRDIPALVRTSDERSALAEAVVENLQREDLTPLEEAAAYTQLLEDFAMTHEQVGTLVGKSRTAVTNTLRLLTLSPAIQGMLERGELSAGHARALVGLDDERFAEHVARRAVDEGWSVRRIEETVQGTEGDDDDPAPPVREVRPPVLFELEQRLAEQLGAKVEIQYRNDHGRMVIHYGSVAELERLYRRSTRLTISCIGGGRCPEQERRHRLPPRLSPTDESSDGRGDHHCWSPCLLEYGYGTPVNHQVEVRCHLGGEQRPRLAPAHRTGEEEDSRLPRPVTGKTRSSRRRDDWLGGPGPARVARCLRFGTEEALPPWLWRAMAAPLAAAQARFTLFACPAPGIEVDPATRQCPGEGTEPLPFVDRLASGSLGVT